MSIVVSRKLNPLSLHYIASVSLPLVSSLLPTSEDVTGATGALFGVILALGGFVATVDALLPRGCRVIVFV